MRSLMHVGHYSHTRLELDKSALLHELACIRLSFKMVAYDVVKSTSIITNIIFKFNFISYHNVG